MKIKKLMTALLATFLVMHGGLQGQVSKKRKSTNGKAHSETHQ